jgi:hypothetical protein
LVLFKVLFYVDQKLKINHYYREILVHMATGQSYSEIYCMWTVEKYGELVMEGNFSLL